MKKFDCKNKNKNVCTSLKQKIKYFDDDYF